MMKFKISPLIIIALLLFSFAVNPALARELKIGYFDSNKILSQYQDYKDAMELLKEEEGKYEQQAIQMEMDIQNLEEEIEAKNLMWSEEKRLEKQQEWQNLYLQYQQFLQEIWGPTGKLYQRNLELSKPIIDRIQDVITQIGEEEGYDFILDAGQGNVAFAKPEFDITDRVIEELSKK